MTYPYPQLNPPPFVWQKAPNVSEPKVHEWIETLSPDKELVNWQDIDVTLLGIPLSRSSISASAASETPLAMRQAWQGFNPYNLDHDIDLTPLRVVDLGDVKQHVTDITQCHTNITEAMQAMRTYHPHTFPLALGGDHSITAMLVKGWKQAHPQERIGILQLDTHFDLRSLEDNGPSNGTPIRNLIESGTIAGIDVWNIGLHGFFNAKSLKAYADEAGVHYVTMRDTRNQGIESVVKRALDDLKTRVDTIYFTVDMDVLDIAYSPGAPATTPGGMRTDELFEAVYLAGCESAVKAMDIVCLDPHKDVAEASIKAGVHTMLSFLTGYVNRTGLYQAQV